jgi:hypothetical protein
MPTAAFDPLRKFGSKLPAILVGLPPQTQSPEHIAHGAESRRPGKLNRWRLLAVLRNPCAPPRPHDGDNQVRRNRIRSCNWSPSRWHRMRSHFRWKNPLTSCTVSIGVRSRPRDRHPIGARRNTAGRVPIGRLVPRITSARNAVFPCLADSRSTDSGY